MNHTRVLFFADSHLGLDHPIRRRPGRTYRGDDFFRNFRFILDYALEQKVDLVIHGGDLFDRSDVHRHIVDRAYDMLFEFADHGIPLVMVPGNHDRSTLPTSLFLQHPNLHIFFEPQVFSFALNNVRLNIAGIPFVRNIGMEITDLIARLENQLADEEAVSWLLMHQSFEGAQVGLVNYTFRKGRDVIGKDQLLSRKFHAYLSGHIHRHQILPTKNEIYGTSVPFIYPGSIERTSFAEKEEEKGFTILTISDSKILEVDFRTLPSKHMHAFTIPPGIKEKEVIRKLIQEELIDLPSDAIVRIGSPTQEISNLLKDALKALDLAERDVQIRHKWLRSINK